MRIATFVLASILLSACGTFKKAKQSDSAGWGKAPVVEAQAPVEVDPQEAAEHKAAAYDALARMHRAQARRDNEEMEEALDEAMEHARTLTALGADDPEVRELYRSVVTAYETYYGVDDTLSVEYGEIFALREEMFASMNELDEPLLEDVFLPEVKRVGGTIPMTRNRLVEQSISFLRREPDRHVYPWIRRSATYFPMIESILREESVPDELKYLAMIESGLNPRARSRVGAGGMWQFMPATGRGYGLQITHWVDERSDPEKATRAAARHLRDLYQTFGDWHLALAAYNCGPTRVRRAVQRFESGSDRTANFWDIYHELPRETRNYVPMFIATSMVVSDPQSFGLSRVEPGPAYDFDVVEVEGPMDLRVAADLSGTSVETLRALNPEIRQWAVPPSRTSYRLRVPSGSADRFDRAYAEMPSDRRRGHVEHRVVRGESLSRIARRYGTSVDAIRAYNSIDGSLIREGEVLFVPVRYDASTGAPEDRTPVRLASDDGTTGSRRSSAVRGPSEPDESSGARLRVRYRVRRGDNLSRIATKYGVSVSSIRSWNDLSSDRIYAGQTLTLYPDDNAPVSPSAQWISYRVQRGDTLTSIARRYDASVADLRKWNALSSDVIRVGQRLAVYTR